jgi:hypothetical protein
MFSAPHKEYRNGNQAGRWSTDSLNEDVLEVRPPQKRKYETSFIWMIR